MADEPNPIDVEVGRRLKQRRTLIGMSQERLGELLGITYQQVQKYERGANRIGSSRLFAICRALEVPASYFLDQPQQSPAAMPPQAAAPHATPAPGLAEAAVADGFTFDGPQAPPRPRPMPSESERIAVGERETLELVRAFRRIGDPLIRRRLFELAKALGRLSYTSDVAGPRSS